MSFTSLLIDTFTPQTLTETTDGQGGFTKTWTDGTDFVGRLSQLSATERMAEDKETAFATYKIFCATTVDVDVDDRVIFGTRTFEVISVQQYSDFEATHQKEIRVREVDYDL